jgi:hypothetical protein
MCGPRLRRPHRGPSADAGAVLGPPLGGLFWVSGEPGRERGARPILRAPRPRSCGRRRSHHRKHGAAPLLASVTPGWDSAQPDAVRRRPTPAVNPQRQDRHPRADIVAGSSQIGTRKSTGRSSGVGRNKGSSRTPWRSLAGSKEENPGAAQRPWAFNNFRAFDAGSPWHSGRGSSQNASNDARTRRLPDIHLA